MTASERLPSLNTGTVLSIPATVIGSHRSETWPQESEMLSYPRSLVMDGEIVCLDEHRHCQFSELLFRRSEPRFIAFDLLHASGKDLRCERLLDRKHELRRVIGNGLPPIIFADHIYKSGIALFEKACELDLEGIVAKHQHAPYDPEKHLVQDPESELFADGWTRGTI